MTKIIIGGFCSPALLVAMTRACFEVVEVQDITALLPSIRVGQLKEPNERTYGPPKKRRKGKAVKW